MLASFMLSPLARARGLLATLAAYRWKIALFVALTVVLLATSIPGVFTVDEPHYISTLVALRDGRLTPPGTEGLPPSRELAWFDPENRGRVVTSTPVAANVPPLWAPLAAPFSLAGWRGLVLLNTLAFLATAALCHWLATVISGSARAGWWAAGAFAVGGFQIEYAQGVWPQSLSSMLTMAAVCSALLASERASRAAAFSAGWLAALATGLRYQNVLVVCALGALLVVRARERRRLVPVFLVGALLPLAASSILNHERLGSWNPISKGPRYLSIPLNVQVGSEPRSSEPGTSEPASYGEDVARLIWARLVDYGARPFGPPETWMTDWMHRGSGGALLATGVVKKSLVQSAPWVVVALGWAVARLARRRLRPGAETTFAMAALGLVVLVVGVLAIAGRGRDDGLVYNQRYLLDLVAPLAVCFGTAMASIDIRARAGVRGLLMGAAMVLIALLLGPASASHQWLVRFFPIVLGVGLVTAWVGRSKVRPALLATLAVTSISWAFFLHLSTDLQASRAIRRGCLQRAEIVAKHVPPRAAIVAWGGRKDMLAAVVLEGSQTVIDASADGGEAARATVEALLARGDRVFVWLERMPVAAQDAILSGRPLRQYAAIGKVPLLVETIRRLPGLPEAATVSPGDPKR